MRSGQCRKSPEQTKSLLPVTQGLHYKSCDFAGHIFPAISHICGGVAATNSGVGRQELIGIYAVNLKTQD
ncbi:hypothetical protein AOLI_G00310740 [Acnodon oligacanthus]